MQPESLRDPLTFAKVLWPHVYFYDKQRAIIDSTRTTDETFVIAGNMLGKDFAAAFIVIWYFLTRTPCRIVTTSATADHLRVLWGEINTFLATARYPLTTDKGGPIQQTFMELRKIVNGERCPKSYVIGMVASDKTIAAMQGHHIANVGDGVPRTMFVVDESSSVSDEYKRMADTWANRHLVFGNPWPCDNFFRKADRVGSTKYRNLIRITAKDSPNVRLGLLEKMAGKEPSNRILVPGVKSWAQYEKDLATMDEMQRCVSLEARFYTGKEVLLWPDEVRELCRRRALEGKGRARKAKSIGIDTAEGGDSTSMCAGDEFGIISVRSMKTPNTDLICGMVLGFAKEMGCEDSSNWWFDIGGGGKEHSDRLTGLGYRPRTVSFGGKPKLRLRRGMHLLETRSDMQDTQYAYFNLRAQMYHEFALACKAGYGVPDWDPACIELHRQMSMVPKVSGSWSMWDSEGRIRMLPKGGDAEPNLRTIMGCSPDELDSAVVMHHGLMERPYHPIIQVA